MSRTIMSIFLVVLISGCGRTFLESEGDACPVMCPAGPVGPQGAPGADGDTNSGSRLKARFRAGTDGSREFLGWYDSSLESNCTFFPHNGKDWCFDQPVTALEPSWSYSDPACTKPVLTDYLWNYVNGYVQTTDGTEDFLWRRGADVGYAFCYQMYDGACATYQTCVDAYKEPVYEGYPVDVSQFVSAGEEIDM